MIRALFGGSFDPVHNGHVAVVDHLLRTGLADHVHVVPARRSPHKGQDAADPAVRLELARLAFAGRPGVTVDDRETRRPGPSYTVDTVRELADEHPGDRWRLVIGADNLAGLGTWHEAEALLRLVEVVVMPRDGARPQLPLDIAPERVLLVDDFDEPVSSTAIRAMLAAGKLPVDALPAAVASRIRAGGLYGPGRT
ncbi:MAG: nicotinate (nicotinamide) nucleotide adenylyltransferase [Candidatus Krumholzibacteriia bacterium]